MAKSIEIAAKTMNSMGIIYGMGIPKGQGLKNKVLAFICMQRPAIAVMGPLMFFAAAVLAIGRIPSLGDLILGSAAVYLLSAAEHSIDDTIDMEIDRLKWPTRPLPSGVLRRRTGGLYAISMASTGVLISYFVFNWQLVVVELIALGLGTLYPFMRNKVGYLVLAPIPPLIAVGGWVAYSPDTLFTSPLPWILYVIFFLWQAFHILTLPWAINVAKTFIVRLKPKNVVYLSVVFSVFTLIGTFYLATFIAGSWIFVLTMIILSVVFWLIMIPLIDDPTNLQNSLMATMVATNYNIVMCAVLIWVAL
jgi:geranylgeranylglycerol-phosphate geranylgeranyltransferase